MRVHTALEAREHARHALTLLTHTSASARVTACLAHAPPASRARGPHRGARALRRLGGALVLRVGGVGAGSAGRRKTAPGSADAGTTMAEGKASET